MACNTVEVLTLSIPDLTKMKTEFYDCYVELFNEALDIIRICIVQKLKTIKECRKQAKQLESRLGERFSLQDPPSKVLTSVGSPQNIIKRQNSKREMKRGNSLYQVKEIDLQNI